jgi:hypothetical protein
MMGIEHLLLDAVWFRLKAYIIAESARLRARGVRAW